MKIKITSWNIWHGKHLAEIISYLKSLDSDIIGLQEVVDEVIDSKRANTAEIIAKELGYHCYYHKAFTSDRHERVYDQGNAIISKFPAKENNCFFLSDLSLYQQTAETEPRVVVNANFEISDKRISIFSTHLAYSHKFQPSSMRDLQVDNLLKIITPNKSVLLGDFNCQPDSNEIKKILTSLKNADTKNPKKPTWTVYPFDYHGFVENDLRYRLDNIFTTQDIKVIDFTVNKSKGSDHLPITTTIDF